MTNVLIVAAHPDDAEIAMGMRIRDYVLKGARVRIHCLTTGAPNPDGTAVRRQECLAAGAVLGVHEYTFSKVPDTRFVEHRGHINAELFRVFGETHPDIVYTHFPNDGHLDHTITAQEVTTVALREVNDFSYFRSPYSRHFEPTNIFVGTPDLLGTKAKALTCFTSQSQLDMGLFRQMAEVAHRQHIHHRVVERFPAGMNCAELFHTGRQIEFATPDCQAPTQTTG